MLSSKVSSSHTKEARAFESNDPERDDITAYMHTCNICQEDHPTSNHAEISHLLEVLPQLDEVFTIKQKIGEGTFSCVYLAKLKLASKKFPDSKSNLQYVALKHVIPTSLPNRILVEIDCMHKFGVHPNIIGINSCLRYGHHVVMVMPYFQHDRFCDYINLVDIAEISNYMVNLLDALQFIHRGGIIHRDIKPSNFLYNRKLKRFALVDFGLAQEASKSNFSAHASASTSSIAGTKIQNEHSRTEAVNRGVQSNNKHHFMDQKNKSFLRLLPGPSNSLGSSQSTSHHQLTIRSGDVSTPITNHNAQSLCECKGRPQICQFCLSKPMQSASRAGTPGFRPPEVLLKHPHQTTAVDIWAAGIIFICLLSGRYPFFHGADDLAALAEITTLFGSNVIKNAAAKLGKNFLCAPEKPSVDLKILCETLRPEIKERNAENVQWTKAYNLLTRMLDVNLDTRITASNALQHSFFTLNTK